MFSVSYISMDKNEVALGFHTTEQQGQSPLLPLWKVQEYPSREMDFSLPLEFMLGLENFGSDGPRNHHYHNRDHEQGTDPVAGALTLKRQYFL